MSASSPAWSRWLALWVLFLGTSCQLEKCYSSDVGVGLGRLTIRHAAILTNLVTRDAQCGFASRQVLDSALVQGQPGQEGAVTWTIDGCQLDFGELHPVMRDCVDVETFASGRVKVSATRRIRGTITGNPESPVIPAGPDAISMELDLELDDFHIRRSNSKATLTNVSGALHFVVEPHLALSRTNGVCAVPTMDVSFSQIRYANASVVIDSGDRVFPVDVPSSDFGAQMGKWKDRENSLEGNITVWDTPVALTLPPGEGLDPDYTPESYLEGIACDENLALPLQYRCPSLKEHLAHGAARLTVNQFGTLASLVDADVRCGFSSPTVTGAAIVSGTPGGPGKVTYRLAQPCVLQFPVRTVATRDCDGNEKSVEGTAVVIGTKTVTGILTGDVNQPVAPDSRDPAELSLSATFTDFTVDDSGSGTRLTAQSGTLAGRLRPRLALDTQTGICSHTTSIAELQDLEWTDATLLLGSGAFHFEVKVSVSSLQAQSGSKGERTNYLAGLLISDGLPIAIPPAGVAPLLDPDYQAEAFERSFSCAPHFKLATTEEECDAEAALATNAARLVIQTAGTLASMINSDNLCGFEDVLVKLNPTRVEGDDGSFGLLAWQVADCRVGQTGVSLVSQSCDGKRTLSTGYAQVDAERVVTGERDTAYAVADSIIPRTPDAVTITLSDVLLTDFSAYSLPSGAVSPVARLVLHSGRLFAVVAPIVGERQSEPGRFDVPTPVATFSNVRLLDAYATLEVGGMRFTLVIPETRLLAQNGSLRGVSNTLSGTLRLGSGLTIDLAAVPLDPDFEQTAFDASYACTPDLKAPIPPN
ncbi:MAG: hypothetical protein ACOZIN_02335 [Myxococcota bacterium]